MKRLPKNRAKGFSLIELVIVVVIIGVIAAIAVPRLSRGSEGARDSALQGDLAVLRSALDLYAAEHDGDYPTVADFDVQLTTYTDSAGATSPDKEAPYIYGPYLRKVPPLPVGANKGSKTITTDFSGTTAGAGWCYDPNSGKIAANSTETDASGKIYLKY